MKYIVKANDKFAVGYCVTCGEKCANRCEHQTGCSDLVSNK